MQKEVDESEGHIFKSRKETDCEFIPDATCTNKLHYSRIVGRLNILSLLASFEREIHLTTGANSRHGRGFYSSFRVDVSTVCKVVPDVVTAIWDCLVVTD